MNSGSSITTILNRDSLQTMSLYSKLFKTVSFPINFLETIYVSFQKSSLISWLFGDGVFNVQIGPHPLFLFFNFLYFLF